VNVLAGLCLLGAGCFSLDPLNKPPNMQVGCELSGGRPCGVGDMVQRGDWIRLRMVVSDPDGNEDPSSYRWAAAACRTEKGGMCDPAFDAQHFDEEGGMGTEVQVPVSLPGDINTIGISFEARDDRGGSVTLPLLRPLSDAPSLPSNASDAFAAPASPAMYLRSR
jgi:hypothetical protein